MATETNSDVTKLKGTKILVFVEEALLDVLIVSFHTGTHIFQGALLDSSKKNIPFGITPPAIEAPKDENVSSSTPDGADAKSDEKISSLKLRHTYYQIPAGSQVYYGPIRPYSRYRDKSVRMRKLRPRKVLCSCCAKQVSDDPNQKKTPGMITRNHASKNVQGAKAAVNGASSGGLKIVTRSTKVDSTSKSDCGLLQNGVKGSKSGESKPEEFVKRSRRKSDKMILRKRKSTEVDSSDSSSGPSDKLMRLEVIKSEEAEQVSAAGVSKQTLAKTSPVIKISFANPEGQDMVVKIPRRIQKTSDTEEDSNWSLQENSDYNITSFSTAKAAKKALKKAKKEAQKRAATTMNTSPVSVLSPSNTPHSNDNGDLHFGEKEKHHHHKHKVKRKRKHKCESPELKKCDLENTAVFSASAPTNDSWCLRNNFPGDLSLPASDLGKSPSMLDEVKNQCFQKKLSISLKRLNAQAYMRCSPKYSIEEDSIVSDVSSASNASNCSGSGSDYGDVPDFPKHSSSPLRDVDKVKPITMMRISPNKHGSTDQGVSVGDVVWGKIHGFPWWPGKVLALSIIRENGAISNQAHVSWFGSSTSSYMSCSQLTPFLDDFKIRFNKKKRGPYKEAIKQALHDAQVVSSELPALGFMPS